MEGKTNGGAGLIIITGGGAITHRWQSSSFQAEKTAMQAAIAWIDEHEDWRKALIICDYMLLVDAVGDIMVIILIVFDHIGCNK